jgi:hypothetical protein
MGRETAAKSRTFRDKHGVSKANPTRKALNSPLQTKKSWRCFEHLILGR